MPDDVADPAPRPVVIPSDGATLSGDLTVPVAPAGVVVFAHGTGSGRHSPRNRRVARTLVDAGFATLLLDLLTPAEDAADRFTSHYRFDIGLLADRVVGAIDWLHASKLGELPIGLFGASTGAAAALIAATRTPVAAVVSRGGRPDLAGPALRFVRCPTLLLVGGEDRQVLELNRRALEAMSAPASIEIVPGATHLFEEPGALDLVAHRAATWFRDHLPRAGERPPAGH
ncbi:MAG: dienelactone hydrolase family protein [Deltaproteobacteria bacterium]|nr:dienelactone hydrolase family protein [Deltaproteobacteria bacterium]